MAAWRYEIFLRVLKNISRVSAANQQYITWAFPTLCLTQKRNTSVPGELFLV